LKFGIRKVWDKDSNVIYPICSGLYFLFSFKNLRKTNIFFSAKWMWLMPGNYFFFYPSAKADGNKEVQLKLMAI